MCQWAREENNLQESDSKDEKREKHRKNRSASSSSWRSSLNCKTCWNSYETDRSDETRHLSWDTCCTGDCRNHWWSSQAEQKSFDWKEERSVGSCQAKRCEWQPA